MCVCVCVCVCVSVWLSGRPCRSVAPVEGKKGDGGVKGSKVRGLGEGAWEEAMCKLPM